MVGWYDIFICGSLADYTDMRQRAGSESARQAQRLMVGRGCRAADGVRRGRFWFSRLGRLGAHLGDHLALVRSLAQRRKNGVMEEAPVKLFVMGRNRWRDEQEWRWRGRSIFRGTCTAPDRPTAPRATAYSHLPTCAEPTDAYAYDPRKPVPTRGGGLCAGKRRYPPAH
jgi:predicted acyl esterase